MTRARILLALMVATFAPGLWGQADVWAPMRALDGEWAGESKGEPGVGKVTRSYRFVLNGRFLEVRNKSVWAPGEKNQKGEVHEDWGVISFDRNRKAFVLRQFHVEGFVNQYVWNPRESSGAMVFTSEAIENIPPGWRARESYRWTGKDELTETFALAEPGKEFAVYSESRLRRVDGPRGEK